MSKIDNMIKEKCPNGVVYKTISEIAEIGTGSSNRQDAIEDGVYPFYVRSKDIFRINKYEYDEEAIIIPGEGGIGEIFHYVNGKYALHQRAYRIHILIRELKTKFLYYYMFSFFKDFIMKRAVSATVTSIRKPMIEQFKVPIPPLEVQEEIIDILDKFEKIDLYLNKELEERKKQYEYIKNKLLFNASYDKSTIGELCKITKGRSPIQKTIPGEYPMVVTTPERKSSKEYQFDTAAVCIPLVSSRGHGIASLNHVYYQEGKFALGNILCAVEVQDASRLITKYLYYYLENTKETTIVPLMKGGANVALHMNDINSIELQLPSVENQKKIIKKLDISLKYQDYIKDEIKCRKKQYDYYRNKLLSFGEI